MAKGANASTFRGEAGGLPRCHKYHSSSQASGGYNKPSASGTTVFFIAAPLHALQVVRGGTRCREPGVGLLTLPAAGGYFVTAVVATVATFESALASPLASAAS